MHCMPKTEPVGDHLHLTALWSTDDVYDNLLGLHLTCLQILSMFDG